jgi:hypothetical protein
MKRVFFGLLLAAAVALAGCTVAPPDWSALVGTWNVDLASRPSNWPDTTYVFKADQSLDISWETRSGVAVSYAISDWTANRMTYTVTANASDAGNIGYTGTVCFDLAARGATMKFGWVTNGVATFYLNLVKQ